MYVIGGFEIIGNQLLMAETPLAARLAAAFRLVNS